MMAVPRGERLHYWRLGFAAGAASTSRSNSEIADWLRLNAAYRQQIADDRLAGCLPDLDELIDVLARLLLNPGEAGKE